MDSRLNQSWWALRIALGVVPIVAGLEYLSPLVARVIPASTFMHGVWGTGRVSNVRTRALALPWQGPAHTFARLFSGGSP
jgi:hypothetical protein